MKTRHFCLSKMKFLNHLHHLDDLRYKIDFLSSWNTQDHGESPLLNSPYLIHTRPMFTLPWSITSSDNNKTEKVTKRRMDNSPWGKSWATLWRKLGSLRDFGGCKSLAIEPPNPTCGVWMWDIPVGSDVWRLGTQMVALSEKTVEPLKADSCVHH